MARLKLPVTIQHGLTADIDWRGDEGVAHLKGVDTAGNPFNLRLGKADLELLLAVEKAAEEQLAASA